MSGLNHLFNAHVLEEYMHKRKYKNNKILVLISGIALICGGIGLLIPFLHSYAALGLAFFVVLAAFMIHRFWEETDKHAKMMELQNFVKNIAIFMEMLYLGLS